MQGLTRRSLLPGDGAVAEMLRYGMAAARAIWLDTLVEPQRRIEAGADAKTVRSVMRHSDIKLTLEPVGSPVPRKRSGGGRNGSGCLPYT